MDGLMTLPSAVWVALAGLGGVLGKALVDYVTASREAHLKLTLSERDRLWAEAANLRTALALEAERLGKRISALESDIQRRDERIDALEAEVRELQEENALLRTVMVAHNLTPPARARGE